MKIDTKNKMRVIDVQLLLCLQFLKRTNTQNVAWHYLLTHDIRVVSHIVTCRSGGAAG